MVAEFAGYPHSRSQAVNFEPARDAALGSRLPLVAVIIPALNEEKAIGLVLRDLPRSRVNQVIVVDNGSTDNTAREARSCGATVKYEPKRGYGAACQTAGWPTIVGPQAARECLRVRW